MSSGMDKDITFYVPTRNNEQTLDACLSSIRDQTLQPAEIVVVVDMRSSDQTLDVAKRHPVRILEQHDGTLGTARNQAIQAVSTRWLASCDADVVIEANWLETVAARRKENVAGIAGRTDEYSQNAPDRWRALHMPHHWGEAQLRNPFMLVSEVLFDRNALLAVGGYRNDLNNYEDSDLCQRLRDGGYDLFYEPAAQAWHHRMDSLTGVLDLRWRYAEYRQRNAFDSYSGLLQKIQVNREYALQTLGKTLASGNEELSYISVLLFFHHLIADQNAMLKRRTLIPPSTQAWYSSQTLWVIADTLENVDSPLTNWVQRDLARFSHALSGHLPETPVPPAYENYLAGLRKTIRDFLTELSAEVRSVVDASAAFCHDEHPSRRIPRLHPPTPAQVQSWLDPLPIDPIIADHMCDTWRQIWPSTRQVRLVGACDESDRSAILKTFDLMDENNPGDRNDLVVCPHLERYAEPLKMLEQIGQMASRAVVSYQPPKRFLPGLDVPAARDLASAAARAGWRIMRFDTIVGRTSLALELATDK